MANSTDFVRVALTGLAPMLDTMDNVIGAVQKQGEIAKILVRAGQPIKKEYKRLALLHDATGNLAKSTTHKTKKYPSGNVAVIVGPRHTGTKGASEEKGSGNHSWLVEFGSNGRRRPSNRGKRKMYVSVHKMVNRKMTMHAPYVESDKFAKMMKGYYFLMSSWRNPTRQARAGKGYTHDFLPGGGVYTLHPGETYGAMPKLQLMQKTLLSKGNQARDIARNGIIEAINNALSGAL
jgi:hypothetical protein